MMNDKYISPSYNIKENEKEFVIEIAIPGKNNTDFNIEIENRSLLISTNNENEDSNYTYSRRDFGFSNLKNF